MIFEGSRRFREITSTRRGFDQVHVNSWAVNKSRQRVFRKIHDELRSNVDSLEQECDEQKFRIKSSISGCKLKPMIWGLLRKLRCRQR